jgi:hypothetical protein
LTHDPPGSFALAGYPVHLADSQSARFSLGGISKLLAEKIQAGLGDASRWLKLFNVAYSEKLGMPVFPGSLNIALRSRV